MAFLPGPGRAALGTTREGPRAGPWGVGAKAPEEEELPERQEKTQRSRLGREGCVSRIEGRLCPVLLRGGVDEDKEVTAGFNNVIRSQPLCEPDRPARSRCLWKGW